ncbi:MAG: hypothetical protein D6699_01430 [Aquificota bacterium]|nr:MAG: hypothetical protein D6699_01430 [Aquificota bacterium]
MGIKALLLDIDGVLCIRDEVIEGAPLAFKKLKEKYPVALVTNTTRVPCIRELPEVLEAEA